MHSPTDLIELSPDDDPELFYKKLLYLPEDKVKENVIRFKKYAKYWTLLNFQKDVLRRPTLNVRITYNKRYGWHISSCLKSLPHQEVGRNVCTCKKDFTQPFLYFFKVQREVKQYFKDRCTVCKGYDPQFPRVENE